MELSIVVKNNKKVFNGIYCATIASFIGIPLGLYTTNKILEILNISACEKSRKALNKQMSFGVVMAALLGYLYGYTRPIMYK